MRSYAMCGVIILALQAVLAAQSVVPQMINFQGYLTDNEGNPLHGTFDITFKIYDDSTNGTLLWSEDHDSVLVDSGVFNVLLGSIAEIPEVTFNSANRWLEVTINTPPGQVFPRTRITSVAYAFTDYDWTKKNNGDLYYTGGKVGIGKNSPAYDLDVEGKAYISDTLRVNAPIKFKFDYNSGWVHITAGQARVLHHNLGGDISKYIVCVEGSPNQSGFPIHRANFGTASFRYNLVWYEVGLEWYDLTDSSITVHRASDDNAVVMPEHKRWNYVRVRILKNQ